MDDYERIWLAPMCHDSSAEGRLWCSDRLEDCDEIGCENPAVEYIRADLAADLAADNARKDAEIARLREALIQHNERLRSAAAIAGRDGAETNWQAFRGQCHYTLAEYHELVNEAKSALEQQEVEHG